MAGYGAAVPAIVPVIRECYQTAVAITPTDATAIGPFAAFYVGVTGDVTVIPRNSTTPVLFKGVPAGVVIKLGIQGINATNTTATNIVGLG